MKKETYYKIVHTSEKGTHAEKAQGYPWGFPDRGTQVWTVRVPLCPLPPCYAEKVAGRWIITDAATGMKICDGPTMEKALDEIRYGRTGQLVVQGGGWERARRGCQKFADMIRDAKQADETAALLFN